MLSRVSKKKFAALANASAACACEQRKNAKKLGSFFDKKLESNNFESSSRANAQKKVFLAKESLF